MGRTGKDKERSFELVSNHLTLLQKKEKRMGQPSPFPSLQGKKEAQTQNTRKKKKKGTPNKKHPSPLGSSLSNSTRKEMSVFHPSKQSSFLEFKNSSRVIQERERCDFEKHPIPFFSGGGKEALFSRQQMRSGFVLTTSRKEIKK
mmetsp:Transcript_43039/g.111402  ORF Transcript_43039/g.111402 Transcript_43039/m.111402 type:complete len:145 (+) Transcript_43039:2071-2505(+)